MRMLVSSKNMQRAVALACCLVFGGGMSGCVSKSKYNRALTANQQAQQQIAEQEQRLQRLRSSLMDLHMAATGQAADPNMSDEEIVAVLRTGLSDRDAQLAQFRGTSEDALTYQLLAKYLFTSGSANLTPQGRQALMKVATWLKESNANNIFVQGFTDDVPIGPNLKRKYASNWELSAHRATSVVRFLVDQGVPEDRLIAVGYGESHPEADGMDEIARQQNRRIEIKLNNGEFKEVVAQIPASVPQDSLIDVNQASVAELIVLPGVTPEFARAVVDYRARAGSINSFDELSQVRGYDAEKMQSLRSMVTFNGQRVEGDSAIQNPDRTGTGTMDRTGTGTEDQRSNQNFDQSGDMNQNLSPNDTTGTDMQRGTTGGTDTMQRGTTGGTDTMQRGTTGTDTQRSPTGTDTMERSTTGTDTGEEDMILAPKEDTQEYMKNSGSPKNTYPDRNSGETGSQQPSQTNPY